MLNKKGWFNPDLMPYSADFQDLSKDGQKKVIRSGQNDGFEEACHTLRTERAAEKSQNPSETT